MGEAINGKGAKLIEELTGEKVGMGPVLKEEERPSNSLVRAAKECVVHGTDFLSVADETDGNDFLWLGNKEVFILAKELLRLGIQTCKNGQTSNALALGLDIATVGITILRNPQDLIQVLHDNIAQYSKAAKIIEDNRIRGLISNAEQTINTLFRKGKKEDA